MQIYNTLGRELVEFVPREQGAVSMYVCGDTVQARPHLGHGRHAVVFDVIRRYLSWLGYDVTYVRNVTDVEDRIIDTANERGVGTEEVVEQSYNDFAEAYRRLRIQEPTVEPWATEHIDDMIDLIGTLIGKDYAYVADGDVYFAVRSFPEYGKLSRHDPDDLRAGERVVPGENKRDPLDFALWKAAKPGEPSWESPWGPGRPGWHIECSAMARRYLGDDFDIHAGGHDLIFPHHENEIAQSEAAFGTVFARLWLHNGMMNLGGEKMAKSTGNVVDLLEVLRSHQPSAVRLLYLRTHYRKPLDFSQEALDDAEASLQRLWTFRRRVDGPVEDPPDAEAMEKFQAAMDDDFDVAGGLGVLFDVVREGNRRLDEGEDVGGLISVFDEIMGMLALDERSEGVADLADSIEQIAKRHGAAADVDALLDRRQQVRTAGEFEAADSIRDELAAIGIVVEDTPDGARWHRR
ncbi:MAG: cysteine--tRNA ligase [Acidimicrobiia bacterium]|nr:MAG: cysteine--tRNA ligase [Acidimicrobiia bacterium]